MLGSLALWAAVLTAVPDPSAGPPPPMPSLGVPSAPSAPWTPPVEPRPAFDGTPLLEHPRLRALEKYRAQAPHRRAVSVPLALRVRLANDPLTNLKPLVDWLMRGVVDPFERVRILHDWVALNLTYDWAGFLANQIPDQSIPAIVRRRTAVCAGYARLFEWVCRTADLECATISGHARGYELPGAGPEDVKKADHAWNAVRIDGAWYLLDVTWDSPGAPGTPAEGQEFSTSYFLLEPEFMIYQHLPTEPAWQLLSEPVDGARFARQLPMSAAFVKLAGSPIEGIGPVNAVEQELSFFVSHPDDVRVQSRVRAKQPVGKSPPPTDFADEQWAGLRREEGGTRITAAAPVAGACEVVVTLWGPRGRSATLIVPMTAQLPADHGYASLSTEFIKVTGAPPAAQQWSNRVAGDFAFTLPHRPGIGITAQLEAVEEADLKSADFADPLASQQWVHLVAGPKQTSITAAFPHPGRYRLNLWASRPGTATVSTTFHLVVEQGSTHGYLSVDPGVLALTGPLLEGPLVSNHVAARTLRLRFRLPPGVSVSGAWQRGAARGEAESSSVDGVTTLDLSFPSAGAYEVTLWAQRRGGRAAPANSTLVIVD